MPGGGFYWDSCPWSFLAWGNVQKLGPCGGVSQTLGGTGIPAPAVTWELADGIDSGGSVFPTAGQRAGAGAAHSSGTLPLS